MQDLRKLLAGSRGEVIVARRLPRAEVEVLERERGDSDATVHGIIANCRDPRLMRLASRSASRAY